MNTDPSSLDFASERIPPQSIDGEQSVLGALLVDNEAITRVTDVLAPPMFYGKSHQLIFAAMLSLFERSHPIDIVTVSQYLKDQGQLEVIGGRQYLADLAMSVATTANIEYYAKVVHDKALLRNLIKASGQIAAQCYDDANADEALEKAEYLVFNLAQGRNLQQLTAIAEVVPQSFAAIEERYNRSDSLSGVASGFYDLDALTNGFQSSDLVIVAARPAMGKTAFALTIAQHVALTKHVPVAIFSLEMGREQLVMRMLCSEAAIDSQRLRTGKLQTNDWARLSQAMGKLGEAPIYIDDSAIVTALDIRAKCRRLKAEKKALGLVIIDYIQLMQGRRSNTNRVEEVSEISRALKTLAREIAVPVIALSQLSRAVESRPDKRPMLSDLRESGSIEQDADIVMFIYREDYYNKESTRRGEADIIISKHRNGPTGTVDLLFHDNITRFLNKAHADG